MIGATLCLGNRRRTAAARRQRGQAAVELVLVLPVVVLALLLVIQLALVAATQVALVNAAREGARAAAVEGTAAAASAAVRSAPGLGSASVAIDADIGPPDGGLARVHVRARVPTEVPLVGALLGDVTLEATTTMRVEAPP